MFIITDGEFIQDVLKSPGELLTGYSSLPIFEDKNPNANLSKLE